MFEIRFLFVLSDEHTYYKRVHIIVRSL